MTYLTGVDLTGDVVEVDGDGAANVEVDPLDADDGAAGAGPELGRHPRHRDVAVSEFDPPTSAPGLANQRER